MNCGFDLHEEIQNGVSIFTNPVGNNLKVKKEDKIVTIDCFKSAKQEKVNDESTNDLSTVQTSKV